LRWRKERAPNVIDDLSTMKKRKYRRGYMKSFGRVAHIRGWIDQLI